MTTKTPSNPNDITRVKGVGQRLAEVLQKLNIFTIQDLLFHLPIRYLDRTRITPIEKLRTNTSVVIQGHVISANVMFGRRCSLAVTVEDDTGSTCLRFYHFNATQKSNFITGRTIRCYGEPRLGAKGIEFYHPEYEFPDDQSAALTEEHLTPIYGLTEGLSQMRLRKLVEQVVTHIESHPPRELLDKEVNTRFDVTSLADALQFLHFPPADAPVEQILASTHPCQKRLAFEELLAHFLVRQEIKQRLQNYSAVQVQQRTLSQKVMEGLPFTPTSAQTRVANEIHTDLSSGKPMLRMVQGDVGSGKTLVAALASADIIEAGHQVAIVAPTEILAEQHFHNFDRWFTPLGITPVWLVGSLTAKKRRDTLESIALGTAKIIVGTHAVMQEGVTFKSLGLSIIDEQHRFGVDQRLSLRQPSATGHIPHQLVMTATPIPRTLAMTAYSELDYSVIDELPPGRTPVNTSLVAQTRRDQLIARVQAACEKGAQAYWVCPLVENSETLSVANAEETVETLKSALKNINIGLVHGRLKSKEKDAVMSAFKAGQINLLVATTVIEVGVDVPNASLMIIENPERLGLAQLHQLRGRVGRGSTESHCVLLYGKKLSAQGKERLQVMRDTNDGFVIAEKDLALRGPGELLGTQQTGEMQFKVADPQTHAALVPMVHDAGKKLLKNQPQTAQALIERWIGDKKYYANA